MNTRIFGLVVLLAAFGFESAQAQLLTYRFMGKLPPGSSLHPQVSDGETFVGTFVVNPSVADSDSSPTMGWYDGAVVLGTLEFSGGFSAPISFNGITVQVFNDNTNAGIPVDGVIIRHASSSSDDLIQIGAMNEDLTTLGSDDIPEPCSLIRRTHLGLPSRNWIQLFYRDSDGVIGFGAMDSNNVSLTVSGGANTWNNSSVGYFVTHANWFDGSAPGPTESASFTLDNTYDVEWNAATGSTTNRHLCVTNGNVLFQTLGGIIRAHKLTGDAIISGAILFVGLGSNRHQLEVETDLFLDDGVLSVGSLSADSRLEVDGAIWLGLTDGFTSNLSVVNSELVANHLRVGDFADATAFFSSGSDVRVNSSIIALAPGTQASLTLNDSIANVGGGGIAVGNRGTGSLTMENGGKFFCSSAVVGHHEFGVGNLVVEDSFSEFNSSGPLSVSYTADTEGVVSVRNNGRLSASRITLGTAHGGEANMAVRDSGSIALVESDLIVGGNDSTCSLVISDGGVVTVGNLVSVRSNDHVSILGSGGTVTAREILLEGYMDLAGSAPDINGDLILSGSAYTLTDNGAITYFLGNVENDGLTIFTATGCESRFFESYSGNGLMTGTGFAVFEGDIQPGFGDGTGTVGTVSTTNNVILDSTASVSIELAGSAVGDFDRMEIDGNAELDGALNVTAIDDFVPDYGSNFVILSIGGVRTGQFAGLPEGQVVTTLNGVDLKITYTGGDGNDVALINTTEIVVPDDFEVIRGIHVAGGEAELAESDNEDFSLRRNPSDIQAVTSVELKTTSPFPAPARMDLVLESSVFARTPVNEVIQLFNFFSESWEPIYAREASRFTDSRLVAPVLGDISRFIEPGSLCIRARVLHGSVSPRQQFSVNIDQFVWLISE